MKLQLCKNADHLGKEVLQGSAAPLVVIYTFKKSHYKLARISYYCIKIFMLVQVSTDHVATVELTLKNCVKK